MSLGTRGVGVLAGALAQLLFLALTARALSVTEFALVVVLTSIGFWLQSFDLGVIAGVVRAVGTKGAGASVFEVRTAMVTLLVLGAGTATACHVGLSIAEHNDVVGAYPAAAGALYLTLAVLASVSRTGLAQLVGESRAVEHYALLVLNPVGLTLGTSVAFLVSPSVNTFLLVHGASACLPGLVSLIRASRVPVASGGSSITAAWEFVRECGPLGMRQFIGNLHYLLLPTTAGLIASASVVADFALAHRLHVSAWSVVGVVFTMRWGKAAAAEREIIRGIARRTNFQSVALAAVLAAAVTVFAMVFGNSIVEGTTNAPGIAALMGILLVVRATYLGDVLVIMVSGVPWSAVAASALLALATAVALVPVGQFWGPGIAVVILVYATLDGVLVRKVSAQGVSNGEFIRQPG